MTLREALTHIAAYFRANLGLEGILRNDKPRMTLRETLVNEIAAFQLNLGPEGNLEYRLNEKPRFVESAPEEWVDVLIDIV